MLQVNYEFHGPLTGETAEQLVDDYKRGARVARTISGTPLLRSGTQPGNAADGRRRPASSPSSCASGPTTRGPIDAALANGAYDTLDAAFAMTPEELITLVQESGLRGKGGAGFGTGQKWSFLPKDVFPRYLAVNGDEGEPSTFKDHMLVERDPHQIIEGVILTAYAIQAHHAFIYLRGEFALGAERLGQALADAYARGFVGADILGSGFDLEIILHRGAGCYIAGDETGLLSSLEGERDAAHQAAVPGGAGRVRRAHDRQQRRDRCRPSRTSSATAGSGTRRWA